MMSQVSSAICMLLWPTMTTRAPASASRMLMPRPMPLPPPVTMAARPLRIGERAPLVMSRSSASAGLSK